jgi:N-acyl-D-aspartate/D-glutamate deacylase
MQFTPGTVQAIASDASRCTWRSDSNMYHYFQGVRIPPIHGWRCMPGVYDDPEHEAAGVFSLEQAIRKLTSQPADFFRFHDRGRLQPGLKADINVIDMDALGIAPPLMVHDLPAGGKRLLQGATGYSANIVSGRVTYRDGTPTGALPGQVLRGPQMANA